MCLTCHLQLLKDKHKDENEASTDEMEPMQ